MWQKRIQESAKVFHKAGVVSKWGKAHNARNRSLKGFSIFHVIFSTHLSEGTFRAVPTAFSDVWKYSVRPCSSAVKDGLLFHLPPATVDQDHLWHCIPFSADTSLSRSLSHFSRSEKQQRVCVRKENSKENIDKTTHSPVFPLLWATYSHLPSLCSPPTWRPFLSVCMGNKRSVSPTGRWIGHVHFVNFLSWRYIWRQKITHCVYISCHHQNK